MKVVVIIPAAGLGTRMAPIPAGAKGKQKKTAPRNSLPNWAALPFSSIRCANLPLSML